MQNPPPTMPEAQNSLTGIMAMLASVLLGCIMDLCIKTLGAQYPLQQIIFARCLFALIPLSIIVYYMGGKKVLDTKRFDLHIVRSLLGISAMFCMFYGVANLPLGEVTALFYSAPIITAALSVPILGEKIGYKRMISIMLGFIGMLFVIGPKQQNFELGYLIVLAGTIIMSLSMIVIRIMGRSEKPLTTTYYFTLSSTLISLIACLIMGIKIPATEHIWLFILMGFCGGTAQFMLTTSFKHAEVGIVMPMRYMAIPINVILGYFIWQEIPNLYAQIGIMMIISGGIYTIYREHKIKQSKFQTMLK